MESGWKWNKSSSTNLVSSGVGLSRSIQRNRFVSLNKVGIRNISMSLLCRRPCVVNASERIMETGLAWYGASCQLGTKLRRKPGQNKALCFWAFVEKRSSGQHGNGSGNGNGSTETGRVNGNGSGLMID